MVGCARDIFQTAFSLYRPMVEGVRELCRVPFIRSLIPLMRALPSWPDHLPKAPATNTITFGNDVSTQDLGDVCLHNSGYLFEKSVGEITWDLTCYFVPKSFSLPLAASCMGELEIWDCLTPAWGTEGNWACTAVSGGVFLHRDHSHPRVGLCSESSSNSSFGYSQAVIPIC